MKKTLLTLSLIVTSTSILSMSYSEYDSKTRKEKALEKISQHLDRLAHMIRFIEDEGRYPRRKTLETDPLEEHESLGNFKGIQIIREDGNILAITIILTKPVPLPLSLFSKTSILVFGQEDLTCYILGYQLRDVIERIEAIHKEQQAKAEAGERKRIAFMLEFSHVKKTPLKIDERELTTPGKALCLPFSS